MSRSIREVVKNEDGAALWVVIVISFIIILIVTSAFTYLFEHRQILQMRLHQLQATELVKNGIAIMKSKLALGEVIDQMSYVEVYSSGRVEITILGHSEEELMVRISGYVDSKAVQSYRVSINTNTALVTQYVKVVEGGE